MDFNLIPRLFSTFQKIRRGAGPGDEAGVDLIQILRMNLGRVVQSSIKLTQG